MAVPILIKINNCTLKNTNRFEFPRYKIFLILIFLHDYKIGSKRKKTLYLLCATTSLDSYLWYPAR